MIKQAEFFSEHYGKIDWAGVLADQFYSEVIQQYQVLANNGYLLLPSKMNDQENINTITPHGVFELKLSHLKQVEFTFLSDCEFSVFAYDVSLFADQTRSIENEYITICRSIANETLQLVNNIILYLHQHLAQRESEKIKLTQHEVIKTKFSVISCKLHSANALISDSKTTAALAIAFNFIIDAVHGLAELGGGRSMLRGNPIEFMFHLKFFQTSFLK